MKGSHILSKGTLILYYWPLRILPSRMAMKWGQIVGVKDWNEVGFRWRRLKSGEPSRMLAQRPRWMWAVTGGKEEYAKEDGKKVNWQGTDWWGRVISGFLCCVAKLEVERERRIGAEAVSSGFIWLGLRSLPWDRAVDFSFSSKLCLCPLWSCLSFWLWMLYWLCEAFCS